MYRVIAILILSAAFHAKANDICNSKGVDVCKKAREVSDEIAGSLPMQMDKSMSLQSVFAIKNTLHLTVLLAYERVFLQEALDKGNISSEKMKELMQKSAQSSICQPQSATKAFIAIGGGVRYVYKFIDGTIYTTVNTEKC
jgi:hypothetical protein